MRTLPTVHPLRDSMCTVARRAVDHGGYPGGRQQSRVRPERHADDLGVATRNFSGTGWQDAHDLGIPRGLERLPREDPA